MAQAQSEINKYLGTRTSLHSIAECVEKFQRSSRAAAFDNNVMVNEGLMKTGGKRGLKFCTSQFGHRVATEPRRPAKLRTHGTASHVTTAHLVRIHGCKTSTPQLLEGLRIAGMTSLYVQENWPLQITGCV